MFTKRSIFVYTSVYNLFTLNFIKVILAIEAGCDVMRVHRLVKYWKGHQITLGNKRVREVNKMVFPRRFDWTNIERVYERVQERDCQKLAAGRYSFETKDATGVLWQGTGYQLSLGEMAAYEHWKLLQIPRRDGSGMMSVVVEAKQELKVKK
jgi:hypothetical protein